MSGRKSSEVAGVLRQGEEVRRMTDGIYAKQIQSDINIYEEAVREIRSLQSTGNGITLTLNAETEQMFGDEAATQRKEFNAVRAELTELSSDVDAGNKIRAQLSDLDNQLASADREAESIRQSIRNKDWYCDDEYRRAQILVGRYKKLRDRRVELQHQMTSLSQNATRQLGRARSSVNRLKSIGAQAEELNSVAKKRQESDAMRRDLKNALDGIDRTWAEKFFSSEYNDLTRNVETTVAGSDDKIIDAFKVVFGKVTEFKSRLDKRVEQFRAEKADAENWVKDVETLADFSLIGPIEYYSKGEDGARTPMFEYIAKYGDKDFKGEYERLLEAGRESIRREEFRAGSETLQKAFNVVMEARDYSAQLQENMLKKTELAGAIQNVMEDLRYNIELHTINDNPNEGYKLTCSIGDEVIDFDRVDIDDEGKVIIDINHHEAVGGTCGSSWKAIASRLQDEGIPVTDVKTGNGKSVLRKPAVTPTPAAELGRQRM